jgi:hypothetical protein
MGSLSQATMPPSDFWMAPAPRLLPQTDFPSPFNAVHVHHFAVFPTPKLALRGAL